MNWDGWEVILSEDLIKLDGKCNTLDENDNLVEHKWIKEVSEFTDLLVVLKLQVVLLQTVKSKFTLVINKDFKLILHEFSANVLDILWHSCWEHHNLLLVRSSLEDLLNIRSHVYSGDEFLNALYWVIIPVSSSILSHSSRTKIFNFDKSRWPFLTKARTLPGVPTTTWGGLRPFRSLMWSSIGWPPYKTSVLTSGRYWVNLVNSF